MAVTYQNGNVTITCDKCGHSQTAKEGEHNDAFMKEGWALYSNARKYKNRCRSCQPPKDRRSHDWVMEKFGHLLPIILIALFASCSPSRYLECPRDVTETGDTIREQMLVTLRPMGFAVSRFGLAIVRDDTCRAHLYCDGRRIKSPVKVWDCETERKRRAK